MGFHRVGTPARTDNLAGPSTLTYSLDNDSVDRVDQIRFHTLLPQEPGSFVDYGCQAAKVSVAANVLLTRLMRGGAPMKWHRECLNDSCEGQHRGTVTTCGYGRGANLGRPE